MRRQWLVSAALALVLVTTWQGSATPADHDNFMVIVHPENPVVEIDRDFLRDAYLKKAKAWRSGATVRPIDLSSSFPARGRFAEDVLKKSLSQLRNYWNQRIFSGKGVPPPEAKSTAAVIKYVLANPGAVAYLPADVDPGGAKVIQLE